MLRSFSAFLVLVLAATNAPWLLDPAFRLPCLFDRILFVPPPDSPARATTIRNFLNERLEAYGDDCEALLLVAQSGAAPTVARRGTAFSSEEFAKATAGLTAFYMSRQWLCAFAGKPRDKHLWDHATTRSASSTKGAMRSRSRPWQSSPPWFPAGWRLRLPSDWWRPQTLTGCRGG